MNALLIPLGVRCNAAIATNAIINQARFPFDWTQMNVDSMLKVFQLKKEEVDAFWKNYFKDIDTEKYHRDTRSWFPHDTFEPEEEKEKTIEKYVRRTYRLIEAFNSPIPKIFVVCFGFPALKTLENSGRIIFEIRNRVSTPHKFIVCNAQFNEMQIENVWFIYERLLRDEEIDLQKEDAWTLLTKKIEGRIRQLLQQFEVDPIAIQDIESKDNS